MAYRRKQGIAKFSTFEDVPIHQPNLDPNPDPNAPNPDDVINESSSSLAAQAIRASAVHRDSSSLSSAYAHHKDYPYEYTSLRTSNESKGFWGVLAQKAKSVLDDDNNSQQFETTDRPRPQMPETTPGPQLYQPYQSLDRSKKMDNPRLRKGLNALSNSLNHIGDTIGNAFEEGRTIVENKTQGIIQETRKLQIRRKGNGLEEQNHIPGVHNPWQQPSVQSTDPQLQFKSETQLKASRDVAMATAAKAKLILRELKTVKADLAFAKERCSQLEEENKILREGREKGINPADDDMIRLQLETLLAEKARLAHENSVYARENRFLREIVEYHQLTMQGVVFLDEGIEEDTEDDPFPEVSRMFSITPPSPSFTRSPTETSPSVTLPLETDVSQTKTPLHEPQIETPQKDDPQKDKTTQKDDPQKDKTTQKDDPQKDKTPQKDDPQNNKTPQKDDPQKDKSKNLISTA